MTMIEKVARAIYATDPDPQPWNDEVPVEEWQWKSWEETNDNFRNGALKAARAAIQAMREPTEAIVDDLQVEVDIWPEDIPRPSPNSFLFLSREEVVGIWKAGIDAALSEK